MSRLELRNASVSRDSRSILKEISVAVNRGDFIALIGPNGSGKSTVLRALAGLWPTSEPGGALLDGKDLQSIPRREIARQVAFVPQETLIGFPFTVLELVSMGRYAHRGRFSRENAADRTAVARALQVCDVEHLQHRTVDTLSGGERQRVLIARSLASEPDFILLDEPTASLDIEHALQIHALCQSMAANGCGVIVTSHDLNSIARHSSVVALMHNGNLVATGSQQKVLTTERLQEVFHVRAQTLSAGDGGPHYVFSALAVEKPSDNDSAQRNL